MRHCSRNIEYFDKILRTKGSRRQTKVCRILKFAMKPPGRNKLWPPNTFSWREQQVRPGGAPALSQQTARNFWTYFISLVIQSLSFYFKQRETYLTSQGRNCYKTFWKKRSHFHVTLLYGAFTTFLIYSTLSSNSNFCERNQKFRVERETWKVCSVSGGR